LLLHHRLLHHWNLLLLHSTRHTRHPLPHLLSLVLLLWHLLLEALGQ
jgi:hypothetical protein